MRRNRQLLATVGLALALLLASCGGNDDASSKAATKESPTTACATPRVTTEDGLKIEEITCGTGAEAVSGSTVTVDYVGSLAKNGKVFDSGTYQPRIGTGMVIQGWEEGIPGMRVGGERKLTIPPALGYGAAGYPPDIPPDSTLIFKIKLLDVRTP